MLFNCLRPKGTNPHSSLVALKSEECRFALFYLQSISQSKTLLLSFNGYQALSANQMKCEIEIWQGHVEWVSYKIFEKSAVVYIGLYFLCVMAAIGGTNSDELDFQDEGEKDIAAKETFLSLLLIQRIYQIYHSRKMKMEMVKWDGVTIQRR